MLQDEAVRRMTAILLEMADEPERMAALYGILGEFCHLIRNRLNSLKLSLYLARRSTVTLAPNDWADIDREYKAMELFVEHFQSVCRPLRLNPIPVDLGLFLTEKSHQWQDRFSTHGRTLELLNPQMSVAGTFDPSHLGAALDAMVTWRAQAGPPGTSARIAWSSDLDDLIVHWDEPGTPALDRSGSTEDRPSLALPWVAKVLAAHHGSLQRPDGDEFRLRLRWPISCSSPIVEAAVSPT